MLNYECSEKVDALLADLPFYKLYLLKIDGRSDELEILQLESSNNEKQL